ncbi:metallophosphoesterase [Kroppenstedtia pulmonis]|uniref:Phosphoesterase n=1 Tax=Kroppenstedtia pulmonis TaxID=1380685 RepID=A0A7D3Y008_9BACL|nr:metallophosphoesterase [Kroppenstedtia pulmonis]QKG84060.1 metallophosphoesterase [Kroppenstedtia pulmonis]
MRVLIISDSHGNGKLLERIVETTEADHVIHCGDFCTNRSELPITSMTVVQGNCDWEEVPKEEIWQQEGIRFLVVHGHLHQIKTTLLPLQYRAEEAGAQIVCFGHSHYPFCEMSGSKKQLFINPGSIVSPRGFPHKTYVVLETIRSGKVKVTYFTTEGGVVTERGGTFSLKTTD